MLDADGFELNTSDFKDIFATIWTNPEFKDAQFWVLELDRKINRSHLALILLFVRINEILIRGHPQMTSSRWGGRG